MFLKDPIAQMRHRALMHYLSESLVRILVSQR